MKPTVLIIPGNGCREIRQSNWYGHLHKQLTSHSQQVSIPCICENFPDPDQARRDIWIPHMRSLVEQYCGADGDPENVILVGHSSGAQATLRYTELYPVKAAILVSATYSDLGIPDERASGYYPVLDGETKEPLLNPYEFDKMKENCKIWYQFHSNNDPFIPLTEAERIREGLQLNSPFYQMLPGRSHFFDLFPELLMTIQKITEGN